MRTGRAKYWLLVACVLGLAVGFLLSIAGTSSPVYYLPEAQYGALISEREAMPTDDPKGTLMINGVRAPYDEFTETYYVPQSLSTDTLDGTLTWSVPYASAYLVADTASIEKQKWIASGEAISLKVIAGKNVYERRVIFTGLPMCVVETDADAERRFGDGDRTGGRIRIFEPEGGVNGGYRILTENISYKLRGNSSAKLPKQQYSVQFRTWNNDSLNVETLGLRSVKMLFFSSMYGDESKVRDKLSLEVWNALAAAFPERGNLPASRYAYVEMIQQGKYSGLFGAMDRCAEDGPTGGGGYSAIYKISTRLLEYCKDPEVFMPDNPRLNSCHSVKILWPKQVEPSDWDTVTDYANRVFLRGADALPEDIHAHACLENLIDFSLFVQFAAGLDNIELNMFWYAKPASSGYVLYRTPWDLDCTFGKEHDLTFQTNMALAGELYEQQEILALIKSQPDVIHPLLAARWTELRKTVFSEEAVLALLDADRESITASGALARDTARWPVCRNTADASDIKAFLHERLAFLDGYYGALNG